MLDLLLPEVATAEGTEEIRKASPQQEGLVPDAASPVVEACACWASQAWESVRRRLPVVRGEFSVGLVCVDELHFIGDKQRGHLLEMLLAKLLFLNQILSQPVQLIGMSATLPNARQVSPCRSVGAYLTTCGPDCHLKWPAGRREDMAPSKGGPWHATLAILQPLALVY